MLLGFFYANWNLTLTNKEVIVIPTYDTGRPSPEELKTIIERSLDADKALNIAIIDLSGQSAMADYMIVASGTSSRHVNALAQKLKKRLELQGVKGMRLEGLTQSDWVAMDIGDVIVHLFRPEVRDFYNMEKMWGAMPAVSIAAEQIQA